MSDAVEQSDNDDEHAILASKLLIIDDESLNIAVLHKMLQNTGYTNIVSTTDPRESCTLFTEHTPDLVLLDYRMPHLNGLQVLTEFGKLDKDRSVPVLMLTADANKELRLQVLQAGAKDFVNKPFDRAEVLNRIHNLLEMRQLYNRIKNRNVKLDQLVKERTAKLEQEQAALAALNSNLEGIVHDRTTALQRANVKLESANNAMSELVSIVSHELRTPLTSIKSFAEILRDEDEHIDTESKKKFLTIINDESDRLSRLISDLLDLQKIGSGKMVWKEEPTNLSASVADIVEFFTPAFCEKNLSLNFNTEVGDAIALTENDKIRQVMTNLLSNALKFTNQGGVTISLDIEHKWAKLLLICDDPHTYAALTSICNASNTSIINIKCHEEGAAYLQDHEMNIDLVIVDISACSAVDLSFIEYLHEQHPMLPITTLLGEHVDVDTSINRNSITISKPIDAQQSAETIRSLIVELIGSCPTIPMISIAIKDTGAGIPNNQLNKVFARFHQVDTSQIREQRGTGLGLSICAEIIRHYNGRIWVESTLGEGSTFYLQLPHATENKRNLGEILIAKGLVTQEQLSEALTDQ